MKRPLPPHRHVPESTKKVIEALKADLKANPTPLSPCVDQTEQDIEAYYRTTPVGAAAAVRNTQGHVLQYTVSEIKERRPDLGRVYVGNDSYYMKHGKHCFHPKGQISLVVPTEEVVAWAKEHPMGEMGYTIFRKD